MIQNIEEIVKYAVDEVVEDKLCSMQDIINIKSIIEDCMEGRLLASFSIKNRNEVEASWEDKEAWIYININNNIHITWISKESLVKEFISIYEKIQLTDARFKIYRASLFKVKKKIDTEEKLEIIYHNASVGFLDIKFVDDKIKKEARIILTRKWDDNGESFVYEFKIPNHKYEDVTKWLTNIQRTVATYVNSVKQLFFKEKFMNKILKWKI